MISISDELVISMACIFIGLLVGLFFLSRGGLRLRGTPWPYWGGAFIMYSLYSLGSLALLLNTTRSVWLIFLTAQALSLSYMMFFQATRVLNARSPLLWSLPVSMSVVTVAVFGLHWWNPDVRWAMPELMLLIAGLLGSVNAVEWISRTKLSLTSKAMSGIYWLSMLFVIFMLAGKVATDGAFPWHLTDAEIEAFSIAGIAYLLAVTVGILRVFRNMQRKTDRADLRDLADHLNVSSAPGLMPNKQYRQLIDQRIPQLQQDGEHAHFVILEMVHLAEIGVAYGHKYRQYMRQELTRLMHLAAPPETVIGEIEDHRIGLFMAGSTREKTIDNLDYLTKTINQAAARSDSGINMEIHWSGAALTADVHTYDEFYRQASEWLEPGKPRGIKQHEAFGKT